MRRVARRLLKGEPPSPPWARSTAWSRSTRSPRASRPSVGATQPKASSSERSAPGARSRRTIGCTRLGNQSFERLRLAGAPLRTTEVVVGHARRLRRPAGRLTRGQDADGAPFDDGLHFGAAADEDVAQAGIEFIRNSMGALKSMISTTRVSVGLILPQCSRVSSNTSSSPSFQKK